MTENRKHYAAGSAELRFGGKSTGFKNLNIIFDSGSSYTYFNSQIYHTLLSLVSLVKKMLVLIINLSNSRLVTQHGFCR